MPPFAIRSEDGAWNGISIDLWREIATDLSLAYEFHETDLKDMVAGLQNGTYDAAVAALTMTAEREQVIDFAHPFHNSGLSIAVPANGSTGRAAVLRRVASTGFAKAVAALAVLLFLVGFLAWFFERKRNPEQFGGKAADGIGASFWWSAVTMTTVGYGDKAPRTVGGRIVALIWMFASILLISSFTAAIASALTVSELEAGIKGPEDLPGLRVGTLRDSTSEAYLHREHITAVSYDMPRAALEALAAGEMDAVVYDAPILRYLVNKELRLPLRVLPRVFERQSYAIALPQGSALREPINRLVPDILTCPGSFLTI
ncbi:MAG: transporter substrate-binding domain-containing protein, partial [Planctomycetes bacterium]|nr:transporter substrate-binding domain-containing protein [Planctomycetota bacterium]